MNYGNALNAGIAERECVVDISQFSSLDAAAQSVVDLYFPKTEAPSTVGLSNLRDQFGRMKSMISYITGGTNPP